MPYGLNFHIKIKMNNNDKSPVLCKKNIKKIIIQLLMDLVLILFGM